VGVLSGSDPEPTVRPRLCRIDPVLCFEKSLRRDSLLGSSTSRISLLTLVLETGAGGADAGGGGGMLDLNDDVENAKLLRSGSFGDS
jgi:hypothetical protein